MVDRVGAGGMATVYRARDVRLARDVAVKIIAERFAREPLFVRQFRREAELCAGLSHPNIISVLDAGVVPRDFIVMELVEGMDAGTLLKRHGPPTIGETAHLVVQTCEALAHAHDHGVIHQDVSPHNILIRWPDAAVKLADFGLASDCLNPTARRETGGTPGYIAPEVLGGESPSPRSDLYSLGVVAYRLFAGSTPARPDDPEATALHVAGEAIGVPLAEVCPRLPRALSEAVQRAMADEPDARQESVAKFRAELIRALRVPAGRQRQPALVSKAEAA